MNYEEMLQKFIEKSEGTILTKEVEQAKIPRQYLVQFQKDGKLEHISHGIYITPETKEDRLYYIQLRSEQIIFSNETALVIHGMCCKNSADLPPILTVTVPQTYATNRLRSSGLNVITVKPDLHNLGKSTYITPFHHKIQVYDMERTICDIVKARNKIDKDFFYQVLKQYIKRTDKDYNKLMNYARKLRIKNVLLQYLEVLMA